MFTRSRVFYAAVFSSLLAAAFASAQPDRRLGGVGITVFEEPGYRGRNATFRDEIPDLSAYNLNDRISSFRIPRGESWEVCEHKDFRGRCAVFTGDEPDLGQASWNEQITSLRPVRRDRDDHDRDRDGRWDDRDPDRGRRSRLVLFEQRNFRGQSRDLERFDPDLGDLGDGVSSLTAEGTWEICDRQDFRGRCVTVSGDVPDLRSYGMEDRVASARPARRSDDRNDRIDRNDRYDEPARMILFERPNFRGRSREVFQVETEMFDFNDRAQSARIIGGAWELCEHKDFRGRCVTITGDVPDLETYRFRDMATSARPVRRR